MARETKAAPRTQTAASEREIVIRRHVAAPRERVWAAFTQRDQVDRWWGPKGFTTTTHEMDVRVGGLWRFTMRGPDGTEYPNWIRYREVVRPERLAYDHGGGEPGGEPEFKATVTFEEEDGGTQVTLRSVFPTAEARDHVVREFNAIEGGQQTLARLAAQVEEGTEG